LVCEKLGFNPSDLPEDRIEFSRGRVTSHPHARDVSRRGGHETYGAANAGLRMSAPAAIRNAVGWDASAATLFSRFDKRFLQFDLCYSTHQPSS
jgi:hypothetical protein